MSDSSNDSSVSGVTMAFATGALVGAGVAILFAPQSGRETRDMVANKANDLRDVAGDVVERGKHLVNDVKHRASEVYEKGMEVAQDAIQG